jgi:formiminoglutamase/agmatinase
MTGLHQSFTWIGPSVDPSDVQIGDVVESITLETAPDYDAVLVGEPYDGAVVSRQGAARGPNALRTRLAEMKAYHFDGGPLPAIGDLGDVDFDEGAVESVHDQLRFVTQEIHELDTLPVFLGGDNSISVPNVGPLLESGRTAVVNFDAHLDCREIHEEPSSGTPFRQLIEQGLDDYTVVGARHFETSQPYVEYVEEQGGKIVTAGEVADRGLAVVDDIVDRIDGVFDNVYLEIDVDVLDASVAPGVSAPTPGGLTARELYSMAYDLASRLDLAAVGFVECAPPLDTTDRTVMAASRAIAHVLAGHVSKG